MGVTLSSLWFYFVGVLLLLAAVLLVAGTQLLEGAMGGGVFAGVGIVFALIIGLFAVLFLLVGWGIWKGRSWGRIGGIVLAVLGVLGGLSALTGNSLVYGVVTIAIWGGIIYALWMAKSWFMAR
ncbi:MAG TPA: hypothetical protein VM284_02705 [Candidatus Limnocylindria bacterium]|nr:hypothetical protein [Candidatus Limnocylindria bacterium]